MPQIHQCHQFSPEETYQYLKTYMTFKNYSKYHLSIFARQIAEFNELPERQQNYVPDFIKNVHKKMACVQQNQKILDKILEISGAEEMCDRIGMDYVRPATGSKRSRTAKSELFDEVTPAKKPKLSVDEFLRQKLNKEIKTNCLEFEKIEKMVIHQLYREWSANGKFDRDSAFEPILNYLSENMKEIKTTFDQSPKLKVLIPGCGTGRLNIEIAEKFEIPVIGNEYSLFTIWLSKFVLSSKFTDMKQNYQIYPWIHSSSNKTSIESSTRQINFPDLNQQAFEKVSDKNLLSMHCGNFLQIFNKDGKCCDDDQRNQKFPIVITCWFIDTARNLIEYLETIYNLLPEKGVWLNIGPLYYHFEKENRVNLGNLNDQGTKRKITSPFYPDEKLKSFGSVEFTLEQVIEIIGKIGFEFKIRPEKKRLRYSLDEESMMKTFFDGYFWKKKLCQKTMASTELPQTNFVPGKINITPKTAKNQYFPVKIKSLKNGQASNDQFEIKNNNYYEISIIGKVHCGRDKRKRYVTNIEKATLISQDELFYDEDDEQIKSGQLKNYQNFLVSLNKKEMALIIYVKCQNDRFSHAIGLLFPLSKNRGLLTSTKILERFQNEILPVFSSESKDSKSETTSSKKDFNFLSSKQMEESSIKDKIEYLSILTTKMVNSAEKFSELRQAVKIYLHYLPRDSIISLIECLNSGSKTVTNSQDSNFSFKFLVVIFLLHLESIDQPTEDHIKTVMKLTGRLFMFNQARPKIVKIRTNSGKSSKSGSSSMGNKIIDDPKMQDIHFQDLIDQHVFPLYQENVLLKSVYDRSINLKWPGSGGKTDDEDDSDSDSSTSSGEEKNLNRNQEAFEEEDTFENFLASQKNKKLLDTPDNPEYSSSNFSNSITQSVSKYSYSHQNSISNLSRPSSNLSSISQNLSVMANSNKAVTLANFRANFRNSRRSFGDSSVSRTKSEIFVGGQKNSLPNRTMSQTYSQLQMINKTPKTTKIIKNLPICQQTPKIKQLHTRATLQQIRIQRKILKFQQNKKIEKKQPGKENQEPDKKTKNLRESLLTEIEKDAEKMEAELKGKSLEELINVQYNANQDYSAKPTLLRHIKNPSKIKSAFDVPFIDPFKNSKSKPPPTHFGQVLSKNQNCQKKRLKLDLREWFQDAYDTVRKQQKNDRETKWKQQKEELENKKKIRELRTVQNSPMKKTNQLSLNSNLNLISLKSPFKSSSFRLADGKSTIKSKAKCDYWLDQNSSFHEENINLPGKLTVAPKRNLDKMLESATKSENDNLNVTIRYNDLEQGVDTFEYNFGEGPIKKFKSNDVKQPVLQCPELALFSESSRDTSNLKSISIKTSSIGSSKTIENLLKNSNSNVTLFRTPDRPILANSDLVNSNSTPNLIASTLDSTSNSTQKRTEQISTPDPNRTITSPMALSPAHLKDLTTKKILTPEGSLPGSFPPKPVFSNLLDSDGEDDQEEEEVESLKGDCQPQNNLNDTPRRNQKKLAKISFNFGHNNKNITDSGLIPSSTSNGPLKVLETAQKPSTNLKLEKDQRTDSIESVDSLNALFYNQESMPGAP